MKKLKIVGSFAVAALLTACGGSSSSSDSTSGDVTSPPFGSIDDDYRFDVTLPDGTVIDRPKLEDIDPDNVPVEMELEYEWWVEDTQHLRDPRGNVYEFIMTDGGVESRQYLVFDWAGIDAGVVYALTDSGECYSRPTADSLNGPLYGSTLKVSDSESHAFDLQFNVMDAYVDGDSPSGSIWQIRWVQGGNGLIDEIQLVDSHGEVVTSATSDEDALEYTLKDGSADTFIRIPFEPMENVYSDDFIYNVCPRESGDPVVYEGFTVEFESDEGIVESRSFKYAALLSASVFVDRYRFKDFWEETFDTVYIEENFDDRYVYVGFTEHEGSDYYETSCFAPSFPVVLNHDYRSGGLIGYSNWSGKEGGQVPLLLTPDADGVIVESSDPQLGLTPADISFADLSRQRC